MSATITKPVAETLLEILVRHTKHRNTRPFVGEFISHVTNDTEGIPYRFLSEDYYQFEFAGDGTASNPFHVVALSEKPAVLAQAVKANNDIAAVFYGSKVA